MNGLSKAQWIGVVAALVIVFLFFGYNYLPNFFNISNTTNMNQSANDQNAAPEVASQTITSPAGDMTFQDFAVGGGEAAAAGDKVTVNYTGTFTNGTKFDSSYDHGQPFTFTLGAGDVIAGWDLGVVGMKEGGKRRLIVPASLGYGPNDYGPIPGNSTLIFDVELVKVEHPAK